MLQNRGFYMGRTFWWWLVLFRLEVIWEIQKKMLEKQIIRISEDEKILGTIYLNDL